MFINYLAILENWYNCIHCKGSQNPYTYTWESLERRYINGITEVQCDISYKFVNVQRLIADIATPPVVQVGERWPEPILDRSSPFNPGPVTIINTGGGDYRYTTVSKNAQYAERDITNNNAQSPEEIAKLLKTLLSDLDLNANSDTDDLKEELLYQSPTTQNQLWDWMDRVMRDADTRDETIKTFAEVIGSQFGLAGTVAAGSFKIIYTALTKARRKRKELPADYSNPFDASGLW